MTQPWTMAQLLPHRPPMILLDEVVDEAPETLAASVTIRAGAAFVTELGAPAHVGIEYMAQACGAWVGLAARRAGNEPALGYLLGTRRFRAEIEHFPLGARLLVRVAVSFRDGPLGVFDCTISDAAGRELAAASLTLMSGEE
jgi:predicted hotdog family 3-hydroxylacyl-ACP dehydratase